MESRASRIQHTSLQQAARWYVTLQDVDCPAVLQEQWRDWFEQHSEHRAAWHYVERVGEHFAPLRDQAPQAGGALRQTRAKGMSRRQATKTLMWLGVGSLVGLSGWRASTLTGWTADLATGTGENRKVRLEDGSELWLGARTAVDTGFDTRTRRLDLRFGELLLQTAERDTRPFIVRTECGELEVASGTARLGIRQQESHTRLDVYQGAVNVCTTHNDRRQQVLADQGIDFTPSIIHSPTAAQAAGESWTRGVLAAEAMPLSELVDTLSRYRHGHLGYAPTVAKLSVMGTFPLGDTDQALHLLEAALPVRVRRLTHWWVSVEAA